MQQQANAVVAIFRVVAAVVEHTDAVVIQAEGGGHGLVVHFHKEQAEDAGAGGDGGHAPEKGFPFRGQEIGLVGVAAAHQVQEGVHTGGGIVGLGNAVPPPVGVALQTAQLAAEFVAVFLGQTGQVVVPAAGKGAARGDILLGDVNGVAARRGHSGQHGQGGGILGDGVEVQAAPAVGGDGVQEGRVEGRFAAGGDDEVVVVKGVAVADEGVVAAAAGEGGDGGDGAGGVGLIEPGQVASVAEGFPPQLLPGRGDVQVIHGGAGQQFLPLRADLLKGG